MDQPKIVVHPDAVLEDLIYDLFICAIGYEARACHLAKVWKGKYRTGVGLSFVERKILNFQANLDWANGAGFLVKDFLDDSLDTGFLLDAAYFERKESDREKPLRILIDISSMSRPMIAWLIAWLGSASAEWMLSVTFAYSPSKYVELGDQLYSMSYIGPVTPSFSGWSDGISAPIVAITGIGGERGLALGAIEFLEATDVWIFAPKGVNSDYDEASGRANAELLERVGSSRVVSYDPLDAFGCFCALESLCYGAMQRERPILLPFGPKIFALSTLLVAQLHRPAIPVWRASGEQSGPAVDREADGRVSILNVSFSS